MPAKPYAMTKREVLQYLADHIPALESLGIKTFRQLEELIQERENEGFQLPRVSPVPPPERPVRVIHGGHSVKVPKPVVVVDSREQDGFAYTFARFPKWFAGVERAKLEAGDYSIKGMEHRLAIERKTLADLVNSAISDRQRFLGQCRCLGSRDRKVIVIEAGLAQIKSQHPESEAHPNAVVGTLVALQERWGIQVVWCDNAELAEETTAHILSKHYTLQWLADNKFPRHFVDGDV